MGPKKQEAKTSSVKSSSKKHSKPTTPKSTSGSGNNDSSHKGNKRKREAVDYEEDRDEEEQEDDENDNDGDDDDDDEEADEDAEEAPPARKVAKNSTSKKAQEKKKAEDKKKAAAKKKKNSSFSSSSSSSDKGVPRGKKLNKLERLEEARKAYKWWEAPELEDGLNWKKLEHAGIAFAPPYVRHNIPMKYAGNILELTQEQEEMASHYAALPDDGPQLGIPKTREVFQKNFFANFKEVFPAGSVMKKFSECDFKAIKEHLELQKSLRKAATDEEKAAKKADKDVIAGQFGYCLIDGRMERVGNYNMEPPGLFRGRGEHPKTGMAKFRTFSESVSMNISQDSVPPVCLLAGHAWESIRHDPNVTWLCKWEENVLGSTKYVMLAASSSFKGKSDTDKYQKAIRLKACISQVRGDYTTKIKSSDGDDRQLGCAMWLIDILALRVGGEKGEDEADTVGCCSLRSEHLTFNPEKDSFEMELEFLGKDSMLYKQTINFAQYGDLGKLVHKRLKAFCANKQPDEQVFDNVDPPLLNKHLTSLMKGLTAKVFRTFNASITLEKELPEASSVVGLSTSEKLALYNAANRQVAILCNHQKTVSKAAETMFENLNEKLATMKGQRVTLIKWKDFLKPKKDQKKTAAFKEEDKDKSKKKETKIPLKEDDKVKIEKLSEALKVAIKLKENAKTNEQKLAGVIAVDKAKADIKEDQGRRLLEKHMFSKTPTEAELDRRIETWAESIRKLEVDIRNRDENKEVSLGTSKINYMDPRISVAWCKRVEMPIDKIFAKTLRDKFNWAMAVPPTWKFE